MSAIDRLKRDHAILRAKLSLLEAALRMEPETWFVLREMSRTLLRQLGDHIRREETLMTACQSAVGPETLERLRAEHHDEPQRLRELHQLLAQPSGRSSERLRGELTAVIHGLRRHLGEEETSLFPILQQALADQADEISLRVGASSWLIREQMTVNHVLHEFPETAGVFENLFVNAAFEGYDCLDEVAWRHGMEVEELISRLEEAMRPDETRTTDAAARADRSPACD
jgi:iron-sulfur cluster repair protein YtfE (RIC family)